MGHTKSERRKWKPEPTVHMSYGKKKEKREPTVIMCYIDKTKPCEPKQLRMAPGNFCNVTGEHCWRLKRFKATARRRAKVKPKPEISEEKKGILAEFAKVLRGGRGR